MIAKSKIELAVGLFIVIGLAILVLFVFFIRDFQIVKPGYKFDIVFGFANGVKLNAPVRFAGVDVGEVKEIQIFNDGGTKVRIKVWAASETKIPADSKVIINTLGLLGEKYIEILPGSDYARLMKKGDVISGKDPVAMDEITDQAKKMVLKLDTTLNGLNDVLAKIKSGEGTLGKLIYDEEMYKNINEVIVKINTGQGTLGKLLSDDSVYKNFQEMSDDLRRNPWKLLFKPKEKPPVRK